MRMIWCVFLSFVASVGAAAPSEVRLSEHVTVLEGPVNGVLVRRNGKNAVFYGDHRERPAAADLVLFTHHRRDVAWAGQRLLGPAVRAIIPANEAALFTLVAAWWTAFAEKRFHDYDQQTTKILVEPITPARTVAAGDVVSWEGIDIRVVETPGYTRGGVSYVFTADGTTIACTGDLIYGDGRLFDWYSLQDAIGEAHIGGYHGYGARSPQLLASLDRILALKPDILVPARGPVIRDPAAAAARLGERLRRAYANYLSIDALRWYFKDEHLRKKARRLLGLSAEIDWLARAETLNEKPPPWIVPFGTSRLIVAGDRSAFLVDCGSPAAVATVKAMRDEGRISGLDGVYVTHYHDDHTNNVMEISAAYGCPVYACEEIADVLENPGAYRLPAMTHTPIRPVTDMPSGCVMHWREFTLTFSHFPGQTLYHGGLVVAKEGAERIFFIGDSFTPCGIDDYCQLNRNFLHPGEGFLRCLDVLRAMPPDYLLINEHVVPTFRFSPEQLDRMTAVLERRVEILRDLFPWDDPNYGLDEGWVRCYPYGQAAKGGATCEVAVLVRNHSPEEREARLRLRPPEGWSAEPAEASVRVPANGTGTAGFRVAVPAGAAPGVGVAVVDVTYGEWELREWTEALFVVSS